MREALLEGVIEMAVLGIETLGAVFLTAIGILSEQIGVASVNGGDMIGLWYVYIGAVALYAGVYVLGYERLVPRLRERLDTV